MPSLSCTVRQPCKSTSKLMIILWQNWYIWEILKIATQILISLSFTIFLWNQKPKVTHFCARGTQLLSSRVCALCPMLLPLFCSCRHTIFSEIRHCQRGALSRRYGGITRKSSAATSQFCPAALFPVCQRRTGASACLLAMSSSCKLEGSPERGAETEPNNRCRDGEQCVGMMEMRRKTRKGRRRRLERCRHLQDHYVMIDSDRKTVHVRRDLMLQPRMFSLP